MKNKPVKKLAWLCGSILLTGCQAFQQSDVPQGAERELQQAAAQQAPARASAAPVPLAVTQDLLSSSYTPVQPELPRFDVAAANAGLNDFFQSLVADTPYSVVMHPGVSGEINLQLKQVTLPETMAIVQQLYGFDVRQQGLIYKIYPAGLRTESIPVNYLMMQRQGFSSVAVNSGGVSQDNQNNQNGRGGRNGGRGPGRGNRNNSNRNHGGYGYGGRGNSRGRNGGRGGPGRGGRRGRDDKNDERTIQEVDKNNDTKKEDDTNSKNNGSPTKGGSAGLSFK